MSLRSRDQLRQEIRLRRRIEELQHQVGDHLEGWGRLANRSNLESRARAEHALAAASGELQWAFDGLGVYGNQIAMNRLLDLAAPLAQTLRWTARDVLFLEGQPGTDADLRELVEPVVSGMFDGSFGLALSAPPVMEQLSLEGSLFERTAERVLTIFRAAQSENAQAEIFQALAGLRQTTLSGLQRLSGQLAEAGRPSWIRWQGDTVLTVTPEDAQALAEVITLAELQEESTVIQAVLEGADLVSGSFHLVVRRQPDRDKHYRGKAELDAVNSLRGVGLGTRVSARLLIVRLDSPVLEEPKESYILQAISPLQGEP